MKVVDLSNTREFSKVSVTASWLDIVWYCIERQINRVSAIPRCQKTMTATMIKPTTGSNQSQPVFRIAMPASKTPRDTIASLAMCRNAPRMFKSRSRPDINIKAVAVLIIPTAATPDSISSYLTGVIEALNLLPKRFHPQL